MLHAISMFLVGAFFWLLALNKYPFNQKEFQVLNPLKINYKPHLKISGSILILYSMLLFIEIFSSRIVY